MSNLTIGQLAGRAHVNVETIRFYHRRDLLPLPPKPDSGHRSYPEDSITRVRFIKHAQELGFSLAEIGELLSLRVEPGVSCGDVKRRAEVKLTAIEVKLKSLRKMRSALTKLVSTCSGQGPTSACPILEALDHRELKEGERQ